ncbi:MAG: YbhB/YbcL family Raf kinase inhibitor-like protein [Dehalococcoidia bacterium]
MELPISSSAFNEGEGIPDMYTCNGQDISPPLTWKNVPIGTKALTLIVDDPDALGGAFTHWIVFNIPADSRELPAAIPSQDRLLGGALQGKNGFGKTGYGGPCPPPGPAHRYRFTLYALDKPPDLKAGAARKQVLDAMEGTVLAQGQLTGTYKRQ